MSISTNSTPEFVFIKTENRLEKINLQDILFIEGLKEYVKIVCATDNIVTFERLKNLETILPANQFLRVHKSYIINTTKVTSIEGNLLTIGTHFIPISRGKKEMVVKRIF